MTSYLNPALIQYFPLAVVFAAVLAAYTWFNRRRLLSITNTRENIYWYLFTGLKVALIIVLFLAASAPVNVYERRINVSGTAVLEEARNLVANISTIHAILIDTSKSMLYREEGNTTRFDEALNITRSYLKLLNKTSEKVMLITFSGTVHKVCICSPGKALKHLENLRAGEKYTSISTAVTYTLNYLRAAQLPGVIVIVSDGANNYGGEPYDAFIEANKSGYPIVFIRVGFDARANELVEWLETHGFRVYSYNTYTRKLVEELLEKDIWEIRVDAFHAKKLIEMQTSIEEIDPSPTILLLLTAAILVAVIKLEGV